MMSVLFNLIIIYVAFQIIVGFIRGIGVGIIRGLQKEKAARDAEAKKNQGESQ